MWQRSCLLHIQTPTATNSRCLRFRVSTGRVCQDTSPSATSPLQTAWSLGTSSNKNMIYCWAGKGFFLLLLFLCFGIDKPLQIKSTLTVIFTVGQMLCKEGPLLVHLQSSTDQFKTACFCSIKSYNDKHYHCVVQIMVYVAFQTWAFLLLPFNFS